MEGAGEAIKIDDLVRSVLQKLVLRHPVEINGNKTTASAVANIGSIHFMRSAWVWKFGSMR